MARGRPAKPRAHYHQLTVMSHHLRPLVSVMEERLPRRALVLVLEWAMAHRAEILENLDPAIFCQVFAEYGAVTWPGEIDLAPDAMYNAIKAHGFWKLT